MGGKVLVVGASGLVGSTAVDHFLESDDEWQVVAISRRVPVIASKKALPASQGRSA